MGIYWQTGLKQKHEMTRRRLADMSISVYTIHIHRQNPTLMEVFSSFLSPSYQHLGC